MKNFKKISKFSKAIIYVIIGISFSLILEHNAKFTAIKKTKMHVFCNKTYQNSSHLCSSDTDFVQTAQATNLTQSSEKYAKIRENCLLYLTNNTQDNSLENVIFQLPESYFVKLIDTTTEDAYKVAYGEFIGYCKPTSLKRVSFVPLQATTNKIILTTKNDGGTQLRKTASASSEMTALIQGNSNIEYIASISGEKPLDGLSSIWYYVRYFPISEPTIYYEGYIYSERIIAPPEILENIEDEHLDDISESLVQTNTPALDKIAMPTWLKLLLICVLTLPAILFGIYLLKQIYQKRTKADSL